ncbi:DUF2688 domain-containing protein [Desulforamulus ruminis]
MLAKEIQIQIVTTQCKRCGKSLVKTNRSLYGMEELKAKFGDICSDCMSNEELGEMLRAQGTGILGHLRSGRGR